MDDHFIPRHFDPDPNAPDPPSTDTSIVSTQIVATTDASSVASQTSPLAVPTTTTITTTSTSLNSSDQLDASQQIVNEHWMKAFWRPCMAFLYMLICFMDFVGFPLIAMASPIISKFFGINAPYVSWQPLTLTNGGLIHMSFGAILGVAAWTRGRNTNT